MHKNSHTGCLLSSSLAVGWEVQTACDGSSAWLYTDKVYCAWDQCGGWGGGPSAVLRCVGTVSLKIKSLRRSHSAESSAFCGQKNRSISWVVVLTKNPLKDRPLSQLWQTAVPLYDLNVRNPRAIEASELAVMRPNVRKSDER